MFTLTSRKLARAAVVAALPLAGTLCAFFAAGVDPAMALCKYGTPHCVNPNPGQKLPPVGGAKLPDDGWVDPDCKYYPGLCSFPARQTPTSPTSPVRAPVATDKAR